MATLLMIPKRSTQWIRVASASTIRGNASQPWSSTPSAFATSSAHEKLPCRTLSTWKGSEKAKSSFDSVSSSLTTQRRLRSALPDDYYDYDEEKDDEASSISGSRPFLLADIGEGIAEVELLRWFVREGQSISEFDPVCEVQSDKATVEITSRYEGRVEKLAYESTGSMIKVGEPILWIVETAGASSFEDASESPLEKESEAPSGKEAAVASKVTPSSFSSFDEPSPIFPSSNVKSVETQTTSSLDSQGVLEQNTGDDAIPKASKKVLTSPAVRKLAMDHGLDLSTIVGTGPSGRILKGDLLAIVQKPDSPAESDSSDNTSKPGIATASTDKNLENPLREDTVVPLRGYNRIMADTMAASLQIPHMVYSDEINLNRFVRYKMEQQQLDHQRGEETNAQKKLLFLPLAVKAASKALEAYPWLNASFDEAKHEATLWKDHNIGIAMDTPRGLIVPVIKECQNKSLPELAEELQRLKACVVDGGGGLPAEDLRGATFTLSNVGAIGGGGTYMSPIITPPQVAIGALGQIRRLPRFVTPSSTDPATSQTIEEAHICAVSWAADHRIVDGATVARFHKAFKEYMEDPIRLLLELR